MCFGGGGSAGVITMPDTAAYDRLAQQQMDAMKSVQDSGVKSDQQRLNNALLRQQDQLAQVRDITAQRANDTAAQAKRLADLMGAPPPEKNAQAPAVGDARGLATTKGKSALRIERATATSVGPGAGLNIT
jgi:hypothetical protein